MNAATELRPGVFVGLVTRNGDTVLVFEHAKIVLSDAAARALGYMLEDHAASPVCLTRRSKNEGSSRSS